MIDGGVYIRGSFQSTLLLTMATLRASKLSSYMHPDMMVRWDMVTRVRVGVLVRWT